MKKITLFAFLLLFASVLLQAQDDSYTKMITERSNKIISTLNITDTGKFTRVRQLVADQYINLNNIYIDRDKAIATLKKSSLSKDSIMAALKLVEAKTSERVDSLHPLYLTRLSGELTGKQVTAIKDGMTYSVLPVTYKGYMEMIPELTDSQKDQIMKWLIEAREHSMDAESSEKKHAWFGKYKGRINNYLSAAGYDLKRAGEDWEKRRNAARTASGN